MILHITPRADWQAAERAGSYRADSLATEGFIHCSAPRQIVATANRYYQGQPDLLLLVIDPERVAAPIRWEALAALEPFPHIYGPLNLDAVVQVVEFPPAADGSFTMPPALADL